MKTPTISLLEWQKRFGTEKACASAIAKYRWPNGFVCPVCGHIASWYIETRKVYQCSKCKHQTSVTAGTLFHSTNLPLVKWFWAIYLMVSDKRGISAMRLSKQIKVSWLTARNMLSKLRTAMAHRDSVYRLVEELIEMDDTYIGGQRPGKRGRGAAGKKPVLIAVERKDQGSGFIAMKAVDTISKETVKEFLKYHIQKGPHIRTDALPALNVIEEDHIHEKQKTPPHKAAEWLPKVHIIIGNLKSFLNGTYHGVTSKYLQEYLDEFCYRFNRRFWEYQLPFRLLNACVSHTPVIT